MKWFPEYNYILASKSPRRQQLLKLLDIEFTVMVKEVEENYSDEMTCEEIAEYLALLKASPFVNQLGKRDLLITADTIVVLNNKVMGKPDNEDEAFLMLKKLSGREHKVITGVALTSEFKQKVFHAVTVVHFKKLMDNEINYYISRFKPFDKAGGYGIQEWIGYTGISSIEGSFQNVMGLPVQKLYQEILDF